LLLLVRKKLKKTDWKIHHRRTACRAVYLVSTRRCVRRDGAGLGLSSPVIDGVDSWADVPAAKIVDAEHGVMQCV
jgi:hypothetical protein